MGQPEVKYLGYLANKNGIAPIPENVEHIVNNSKNPTSTVAELQRFLSMLNYYRKSIPHAAETQMPLRKYTINCKNDDE